MHGHFTLRARSFQCRLTEARAAYPLLRGRLKGGGMSYLEYEILFERDDCTDRKVEPRKAGISTGAFVTIKLIATMNQRSQLKLLLNRFDLRS
jgi:hypothetical protein